VVIIAQRNEAEWLQRSLRAAHGIQHFSHAAYRAGFRLERDLDEIAIAERLRQPQESTGHGYRLKFAFCALSIFKHHEGGNRTTQMKARCTFLRVGLGKVSHRQFHYATRPNGEIHY